MPRFTVRDNGTSLNFIKASSQFVRLKTSKLISDQTNATVVMWIKSNQVPPASNQLPALYCERAGSGNDIWKLEILNTSKALRFTHRDDASTLDQITNTTGINVVDNRWHQVVLTKSGTAITIYVDTQVDKAGTLTGTDTLTDASQQVQLGEDVRDANSYYNGLMDEVMIFTRALSAQEIADLYYTGTTANLANLVGYYKFDEGSGTAAIDSSGTQANASISGGNTYSTDVHFKARQAAT